MLRSSMSLPLSIMRYRCVDRVAEIETKEANRRMEIREKISPMIKPPIVWERNRLPTKALNSPESDPCMVRSDIDRNEGGTAENIFSPSSASKFFVRNIDSEKEP